MESDDVTCALLGAHLADTNPADFVNYGTVTANDVSAAAKNSLKATPAYAVLGKTAGVTSFVNVLNMLKA